MHHFRRTAFIFCILAWTFPAGLTFPFAQPAVPEKNCWQKQSVMAHHRALLLKRESWDHVSPHPDKLGSAASSTTSFA